MNGYLTITNYDVDSLPNVKKKRINQLLEASPTPSIYVEILTDKEVLIGEDDEQVDIYGDNDWHIQGVIRLRSFNDILRFLAKGIQKESKVARPQYVPVWVKVPNPTKTLVICPYEEDKDAVKVDEELRSLCRVNAAGIPESVAWSTSYKGKLYWVPDQPWDKSVFAILYQIFQMSVTDTTKNLTPPSLTIAK